MWPGGGCARAGLFVIPGRLPIVIDTHGGCARRGRSVAPGRPPVVTALAEGMRAVVAWGPRSPPIVICAQSVLPVRVGDGLALCAFGAALPL